MVIDGCSASQKSLNLKQTRQPLKKFLPVLAIFKNRIAFDSSDNDMMQRTRGVNAGIAE
jgi:hypothetical protein